MKKALHVKYELTERSFVSREPGFVEAWVTIGWRREWSLIQLKHNTVEIVDREHEFLDFANKEVRIKKSEMRRDLGHVLQE